MAEKKKPLTRPQVQAIQPLPFVEDLAYARNRRGEIVSRYLVPKGKTMVMIPALDKDGKPIGRVKKEFAPERGMYVVKMKRG